MAFDLITPVQMGRGSIAVSPATTTLYTVPARARAFVKTIDIANNGVALGTVVVHLVPSGGAADATNILVPSVRVPANSMFQWTGAQILEPGDTIVLSASAAGFSANISGGEAI